MIAALLIAPQTYTIRHEFVFSTSGPQPATVTLAGTFNGWNKSADPLTFHATTNTWRLAINLPPGRHLYKFVLNDQEWVTDPKNQSQENDGAGNINSVLLLLPADYKNPAQIGDGRIATSLTGHRPALPDLNLDRGRVTVRFRVRPQDAQSVKLEKTTPAIPSDPATKIPMVRVSADLLTETYQASFPYQPNRTVDYRFIIKDGAQTWTFGANGLQTGDKATPLRLDRQSFTPFQVPAWVERTVFYQIFPDRFANGSPHNDPDQMEPWSGTPHYFNFFGGDIAGIRANIPYLQRLGVAGVYFNPVFQGPSNHRYETDDYKKIDHRLGTNQEFKSMVQELRGAGIRTVLDGVFNHTSVDFPPFANIRKNGKNSPYLDWYFINAFPVEVRPNPPYEAWFGYESMPKLNVLHPPVKEFLLGVVDYWYQEIQTDGWRLDVANEVPKPFWRAFRQHVKNTNPDTWILGENWTDSSPWLQGDQWDSSMNYLFRGAALRHIARGVTTPTQFLDELFNSYNLYAPQVSRNLLNFLGTHDTPRFLYEAGEDPDLAKMGAVALFAWVGAPCVYYGDELGMTGGPDPDNRRGMTWQKNTPDNPFLQLYTRLAHTRNNSPALQSGDPLRLFADDELGTSAFARVLPDPQSHQPDLVTDAAIALFNRSEHTRTIRLTLPPAVRKALTKPLTNAANGEPVALRPSGQLVLTLPPRSAALVLPKREITPQGP